jgi:cytochrome c556
MPRNTAGDFRMRSIVLLLVGIVVGALLATTTMGTLNARDRYPRSVMVVMQANLSALQRGLRTQDCGLAEASMRASQLLAVANEIPIAFAAHERDSEDFVQSRERFVAAVEPLTIGPPPDCTSLNTAITNIAQTCDACHNGHR